MMEKVDLRPSFVQRFGRRVFFHVVVAYLSLRERQKGQQRSINVVSDLRGEEGFLSPGECDEYHLGQEEKYDMSGSIYVAPRWRRFVAEHGLVGYVFCTFEASAGFGVGFGAGYHVLPETMCGTSVGYHLGKYLTDF